MSFFFAIVYLIIEYMRPQQMYGFLGGLPLAQVAIIGTIIAFILEKRKLNNFNFQNILLFIILLWIIVAYIFALNQELAWQPLADFAKLVIIYFLLINILNDKKRLYWFVVVLLLLHFKFTQFCVRGLILSGIGNTGVYGGAGLFANPGDLGTAFASIFGISYYMTKIKSEEAFNWSKMKWFFIVVSVSIPIAIIATNSRGASLAVGICLLGIWYKGKRKLVGMIALSAVIVSFIALIPNWERYQASGKEEDETGQNRLILWNAAAQMAKEHPLTGVGPNNFAYVNQSRYHSELTLVQHNVFFQVLSELGYPGLIAYLMLITGCFYNQRKTRKILKANGIDEPFLYSLSHGLDIGLIGFIVAGFFVSVFYYPFFWMILILGVALLDATMKSAKSNVGTK